MFDSSSVSYGVMARRERTWLTILSFRVQSAHDAIGAADNIAIPASTPNPSFRLSNHGEQTGRGDFRLRCYCASHLSKESFSDTLHTNTFAILPRRKTLVS